MVATSSKTRKAKGRALQQKIRDDIISTFSLSEDDVRSCSMGAQGEDIQLSPRARVLFPYSIECKSVEKLNVWDAYSQAKENAKSSVPLLVFKRSRSEPMVMITWEHFLSLHWVDV
jgi:hypothetical protein